MDPKWTGKIFYVSNEDRFREFLEKEGLTVNPYNLQIRIHPWEGHEDSVTEDWVAGGQRLDFYCETKPNLVSVHVDFEDHARLPQEGYFMIVACAEEYLNGSVLDRLKRSSGDNRMNSDLKIIHDLSHPGDFSPATKQAIEYSKGHNFKLEDLIIFN